MMREILFRGKRMDNGEWVEGAFCLKDCDSLYGDMIDDPSIIKYEDPLSGFWFKVYPETVGQYTGLTDKNGKKIFEGDVVKVSEKEDKDLVGAVEWKFECWTVSGANWADTLHMANYLHDLEVIGNIHDNPELLEV